MGSSGRRIARLTLDNLDDLPSSWGYFTPTWVDVLTLVGSFGLFATRSHLVAESPRLDVVLIPAVLGIFAGVNCLFMPVFVLLPFYVREVLGTGPEWYGFLLSGSGLGALAGSAAADNLLRRVPAHAALVRVCLAGVAASVLLLAGTASTWSTGTVPTPSGGGRSVA